LNPNAKPLFALSQLMLRAHFRDGARKDLEYFLHSDIPHIGIEATDLDLVKRPSLEEILLRVPNKRLNRANTYWVAFPGTEGRFYVALNRENTCAYRIADPPAGYPPLELPRTCAAVLIGIGIPRYENKPYSSIVSTIFMFIHVHNT